MIAFEDVTFRYGKRVIFKELSFTAQPGQCTVLAGPNGIGKSTCLALAAGALSPKTGRILRTGRLGYAPQEATVLPDLSVRDNLKFFAALCHAAIPEEPFLPLDPAGKKRVGKLSGGMQKRLSLVCAALGEPEILLLDEPCIGLDVAAQELLFRQIGHWKQQGKCILYAGHNATELEAVCDRLVLLGDGKHRILERKEIPDLEGLLSQWISHPQEEN